MKINTHRIEYAAQTKDKPRVIVATDCWRQDELCDEILQGISDEAAKRHWQLVELALFDGKPPKGLTLDGIFMCHLSSIERFKELKQYAPRIIRLGSAPNLNDDVLPAVLPDLTAQGELAAHHFAERGFSRIGFVGQCPWNIWENLYIGMQRAAKEAGLAQELLSLPAVTAEGQNTDAMAFDLFTDWILKIPKPIGLVCQNDYFAATFCAWAINAGVQIPTEVAILGNGNRTTMCERYLPKISSINTSEYERGIAACDLMAKLLEGKEPPREPIMIPPSGITVRESTDIFAAVDPDVSKALKYIWANIASNVSVDDVAIHVGIHRRKLERRFRAEFGRGVNAELHRRRLETCCELLRNKELTVMEISKMAGFRSDNYLYRTFCKTFGATPSQWRKAQQSAGLSQQTDPTQPLNARP